MVREKYAIVLAAGRGSRISGQVKPAFVIDGESLIQKHVDSLTSHDFRVLIVVSRDTRLPILEALGALGDNQLGRVNIDKSRLVVSTRNQQHVTVLLNEDPDDGTDTGGSFLVAANYISNPQQVVLMDGDIYYRGDILDFFLSRCSSNGVLVSSITEHLPDGQFAYVKGDKCVRFIKDSKLDIEYDHLYESIGVVSFNRFTYKTFRSMQMADTDRWELVFDDLLVTGSKKFPAYHTRTNDVTEIDTPEDMNKAIRYSRKKKSVKVLVLGIDALGKSILSRYPDSFPFLNSVIRDSSCFQQFYMGTQSGEIWPAVWSGTFAARDKSLGPTKASQYVRSVSRDKFFWNSIDPRIRVGLFNPFGLDQHHEDIWSDSCLVGFIARKRYKKWRGNKLWTEATPTYWYKVHEDVYGFCGDYDQIDQSVIDRYIDMLKKVDAEKKYIQMTEVEFRCTIDIIRTLGHPEYMYTLLSAVDEPNHFFWWLPEKIEPVMRHLDKRCADIVTEADPEYLILVSDHDMGPMTKDIVDEAVSAGRTQRHQYYIDPDGKAYISGYRNDSLISAEHHPGAIYAGPQSLNHYTDLKDLQMRLLRDSV